MPDEPDYFDMVIEDATSTMGIDYEEQISMDLTEQFAQTQQDMGDLVTTKEPGRTGAPVPIGSEFDALFNAPPARLTMWRASDAGFNSGPWVEGTNEAGERSNSFDITKSSALVAMFNPTEIEAGMEIEFNRFSSPGASYAHMHFANTKNFSTEFELYFSGITARQLAYTTYARKLLHSWCTPVVEDGWSLGVPRLWIYWEGTFAFQCYMVECRFKHLRFALDGQTTRFTAQIKLEEAADTFKFIGDKPHRQMFGRLVGNVTPAGKPRKTGSYYNRGSLINGVTRLPRKHVR